MGIILFLFGLSVLHSGIDGLLEALVLRIVHHVLLMIGHQLVILRVVLRLHLLNEQVDQVEQIYLVPLLVRRIVQVELNVKVCLLENELDKHALFFDVLLVQCLQFKLFLTLFLQSCVVNFFDFGDHGLYVLFLLLNVIVLLANL